MIELGMPTLIELPSLEDCAALCRELGLQFVELNMNLPQYQTGQIDVSVFQAVRERYGIYFTLHLDENLNPCDFNPYVAQAYRNTAADAVRAAKALGIPILNMHLSPGIHFTLPERKVDLFDVYEERYLKSMRIFRDGCAREIGSSDIKICVENTDGYRDFQIKALDILLESPCFALTYDIGHNCCAGGRDEPVILRRRERLLHFHLHDADRSGCHLPFGDGTLPLGEYVHLAGESGGRAVLEVKTVEGLRKSVCWIRNHENLAKR